MIESANVFEGKRFGVGAKTLLQAVGLAAPLEPVQPSWGEPYKRDRRPG